MMILVKRVIILILVSSCYIARSQQDPTFNQYMFNTLSYNPAYAGQKDALVVNALSRFQWLGIEGAPNTYTITAHSPTFSEQIGIGGSLVYDRLGPERRYSMNFDAAYHMPIDLVHMLSFGLKLGAFGTNVDYSKLTYLDESESLSNDGKLAPNIGFGAFFYSDFYYVGVSAPRMLRSQSPNGSGDPESMQKQHFFVTAGYVYQLSSNLKLKPSALLKMVSGADPQLDLTANFLINETLWLGVLYRTSSYAGVIAQLQPLKKAENIAFGYSFDFPLGKKPTNNFTSSHELMIGYSFLNKNAGKFKSPRYF